MAQQSPARRKPPGSQDDIDAWMRRRNDHVQGAGEAEAAGRKAWVTAIRTGEHLPAAHPSEVRALGRHALEALQTSRPIVRPMPIQEPNPAESMIPFVGPAWAFAADMQNRRYRHAAVDAVGAAIDAPFANALVKGGRRIAEDTAFFRPKTKPWLDDASYAWRHVRDWMGEAKILEKGQHGHHALIPQNGWGKRVPNAIKNQPLNIKGMPDPVTHGRLHHRMGNLPRFNAPQRYLHGTPGWWKAAHASAAGHAATAAMVHRKRSR